MLGDDTPVGDIHDGFILLRRTWKDEGAARFLADRCIGPERGRHVHLVANRVADQRVRAMNGPAEALPFREEQPRLPYQNSVRSFTDAFDMFRSVKVLP